MCVINGYDINYILLNLKMIEYGNFMKAALRNFLSESK